MVNYIRINFEEKWKNAELPYMTSRYIRTKATPKRMQTSIERARKFAETLEVKESDGKPFTRTLKTIELDDGLSRTVMWKSEDKEKE